MGPCGFLSHLNKKKLDSLMSEFEEKFNCWSPLSSESVYISLPILTIHTIAIITVKIVNKVQWDVFLTLYIACILQLLTTIVVHMSFRRHKCHLFGKQSIRDMHCSCLNTHMMSVGMDWIASSMIPTLWVRTLVCILVPFTYVRFDTFKNIRRYRHAHCTFDGHRGWTTRNMGDRPPFSLSLDQSDVPSPQRIESDRVLLWKRYKWWHLSNSVNDVVITAICYAELPCGCYCI